MGGGGLGTDRMGGGWAEALHSAGGPVPLQVVSGIPLLALCYRDKL